MTTLDRRMALAAMATASLAAASVRSANAESISSEEPPSEQLPIRPPRKRKSEAPPISATATTRPIETPSVLSTSELGATKSDVDGVLARGSENASGEPARLSALLAERRSYLGSLAGQRISTALDLRGIDGSRFSSTRCDLLASEAAALVARCAAIRSQWEAMYETSYAFLTDIDRFSALDAIFQQQEASGFYDLDEAVSAGDARSNAILARQLADAADTLKFLLHDMTSKYEAQSGWMQLTGFLSHISGYGNSGDATAEVSWNGKKDRVTTFAKDAANELSWIQFSNSVLQLTAELETRRAQVDSLSARAPGLLARANWDQKNKAFRKAQVEAVRAIYKEKLKLVGDPDGPLNYSERLERMRKTYSGLLTDALSRLPAVAEGLTTLLGIESPLPMSVRDAIAMPHDGNPSDGLLDDVQGWLDVTAGRLATFLQDEQIYSCLVSLREIVAPSSWISFQSNGILPVEVADAMFADQYHVRLRALNVSTRGVRGSLACTLKLPSISHYVHRDGTRAPIDQSHVRPIRQSRAMPADSASAPERFGLNPIYNCSPIGGWEIACAEHTNFGEPLAELSDLFLEFVVVGQ